MNLVCGNMVHNLWYDDWTNWKIRDGSHTNFWLDRWLGGESLAHKYPEAICEFSTTTRGYIKYGSSSEWQVEMEFDLEKILI